MNIFAEKTAQTNDGKEAAFLEFPTQTHETILQIKKRT